MKLQEIEFDVFNNNRPKVLLLGNGLCRAYGGMSWDTLLDEIKDKTKFPRASQDYLIPMPLKAAMLTNGKVASKMHDLVKAKNTTSFTSTSSTIGWDSFVTTTPDMRKQINRLISGHFDYVLTTNYSYEIECALLGKENLSNFEIAQLQNFYEINNAQTVYLINTFNEANSIPVWHIHGEARKPDSMILGNCYYGKLLRKCIERLDGTNIYEQGKRKELSGRTKAFKNAKDLNKPLKIGSWIDAFVLGDVYILGFGMDFSESDLWWLMDYKSSHQDFCGKTIFYEPKETSGKVCVNDSKIKCDKSSSFVNARQCKGLLLKEVYRVDTRDLGQTITNNNYKPFYEAAINDILADLS